MKLKIVSAILCLTFILGLMPVSTIMANSSDDIVILYENDVHCEVDGYSKLSAMKKELQQTHDHVGVVSCGDYIQGTSFGVISRGEYIIHIMNLVGYDALTLGNHEFDFKLGRLHELIDMMNTKPVCCNFQKMGDDESYFDPYSIVSYGDVKVAYIGITTPETLTSSSAGQFRDEQGNLIYTFHSTDLHSVVQAQIDEVVSLGADYVIALSHMGDMEPAYNIDELIAEIEGIDVVLDAHSHSVIDSRILKDKAGNDVVMSSTGTKFEYVGKLTLSGDEITTELISLADYQNTDPEVDAYLEAMKEEYRLLGDRKVAYSEVDLIANDEDGNRIVRVAETNLGDLCADAFRIMLDAEISYVNGGGVRANIDAGDVTFNDLLDVMPFNNHPVVIEATGQEILDMLELVARAWPEAEGGFPHLSGLKFSLNYAIPSSVVLDENEIFVEVAGEYRVYNVQVLNPATGEYEPLDLERTYSLAGQNHHLTEGGGGMSMFQGATVIRDDGILDVEMFENYISEHLDGVVDDRYAEVSVNITFTDGRVTIPETSDRGVEGVLMITTWVISGMVAVAIAYGIAASLKKKESREI